MGSQITILYVGIGSLNSVLTITGNGRALGSSPYVFDYGENNGGEKDVIFSLQDTIDATAIGIYGIKGELVSNILPGQTLTLVLQAGWGTTTTYYIKDSSYPIPSRWEFGCVEGVTVECSIYAKLGDAAEYTSYSTQQYITANHHYPPVHIPLASIPNGGLLGILVPGDFVLYASAVNLIPEFELISSTDIPDKLSIGTSKNVNGKDVITPLNDGVSPTSLSVKVKLARYYIVGKGVYTVRYSDSGKQSMAEAAARARQMAAIIATIKDTLAVVKQVTSIVKDVVDVGSTIVKAASGIPPI